MNAHLDIQRMLAVYPSLDDAQRRVVDAHVGLCRACAEVRSSYMAMDLQIAGLEDLQPPPTLAWRLSSIVRTERQRPGIRLQTMPILVQRVVLPIVLLLGLACGVWLLMHISAPKSPGIAETPSVTPSTTPVVMASQRPVALAMVAYEPCSSATERPCSANPPSRPGPGTALWVRTPVASEVPVHSIASAFRGNP
jgi:hypothetical protein